MKVIDVYEQYFAGSLVFNDVPRHAAAVKLTATSEDGLISYEASVNFFPFEDPEDFRISYDAYFSKLLSQEKGRRTKKKDALYLEQIRDTADELAEAAGGNIDWDRPLICARYDR